MKARLTRTAVAKVLGVSIATVRRMEGKKLFPIVDPEGTRVFNIDEVHRVRDAAVKERGVSPGPSFDYAEQLTAQKNRCVICVQKFMGGLIPCEDRDPVTGKVRGILCQTCHALIGTSRQSILVLWKAINYLETTPK